MYDDEELQQATPTYIYIIPKPLDTHDDDDDGKGAAVITRLRLCG